MTKLTDTTTKTQCPFSEPDDFNLADVTQRQLTSPDVSELMGLSRCQQLSVLLDMTFKDATAADLVASLNEQLISEWEGLCSE